ncbi:alpha-kinase family domain-containing protein [Ditylenchus destructor]|uniref:Alpha-kinase family domain-containing protein n=1 Tax=Ditylenchus destructor TaxID=166010 RepID=A0AAD4MPC7_9BILA|nr:alpha-kinase family domain-containing protein [Ditylenchus destructor]
MIELFSEAMGSEIDVFDIKNVDTLVDNVVSSVSIGTSIHPTMRAKQHVFKIEPYQIGRSVFLSYEMPGSIDEVISGIPLEQKYPTKAKIQIAEHPFAHGAERKTFYGRDLTSNSSTDIVLKEYIRQNTDTASRSAAVPYEIATQMQTIAAYLASEFSDCLQKMAGIVHYDDVKFLTVQISHNFLMVVDLQGISSTDESGRKTLELTDPAIHCIDLTRFGKTNFGFEGMKTFFGRHVCNRFCTAMELKAPAL